MPATQFKKKIERDKANYVPNSSKFNGVMRILFNSRGTVSI
jgi:hypothetical protein